MTRFVATLLVPALTSTTLAHSGHDHAAAPGGEWHLVILFTAIATAAVMGTACFRRARTRRG